MVQTNRAGMDCYRTIGVLIDNNMIWRYPSYDYYHIDESGRNLMVLEREHRKNNDRITIYVKPANKYNDVCGALPFLSMALNFCAKKWLVSQSHYVVAGNIYRKDGLELSVHKIECPDGILKLKKITRIDFSEACDQSDMELLAWDIDVDSFVAFTLQMLREKNTIQIYICKIGEENVACTLIFNLDERKIFFGKVTDVSFWKHKSVVFTTSASQVFRLDLETNELSEALHLDSLNKSKKRATMHIRRAKRYGRNRESKEIYYVCSSAADLFEIMVSTDNKLIKTNDEWELSQIEMPARDINVIGFSIDEFSTRGCLLHANGDVLCIDLLQPFKSI